LTLANGVSVVLAGTCLILKMIKENVGAVSLWFCYGLAIRAIAPSSRGVLSIINPLCRLASEATSPTVLLL